MLLSRETEIVALMKLQILYYFLVSFVNLQSANTKVQTPQSKNNYLFIRDISLIIGHHYQSVSQKLPFSLLHLIAAEGGMEGPRGTPASPIRLLRMKQGSISGRQY